MYLGHLSLELMYHGIRAELNYTHYLIQRESVNIYKVVLQILFRLQIGYINILCKVVVSAVFKADCLYNDTHID